MRKFCLFIVLLTCSSCSVVLKNMLGLKSPRVETKSTISEYLSKNGLSSENQYVLKGSKDSIQIYNNIMRCFNNEVYLFDYKGCKYCYKGDQKCTGIQLKNLFISFEENYQPCLSQKIVLDSILNRISPLNNITFSDSTNEEYYLYMYWSKFFKGKKRLREDINWLSDLQKHSTIKIKIIFINTDLQEDWGLKRGAKLDLKFRLTGKKAGEFEFGSLPLRNDWAYLLKEQVHPQYEGLLGIPTVFILSKEFEQIDIVVGNNPDKLEECLSKLREST